MKSVVQCNMQNGSLGKLKNFQIKMSLTNDQQKHNKRDHL